MRFAAKVDQNHAAIVGCFRACGAKVLSLAAHGKGVPDLLIWHIRKGYFLVEVKNPNQPKAKQKLKPMQAEFHEEWPVVVINSVEGVVAALV